MSQDSGGRSRLLSKVVKFVKSPTTHWADLDRPPSEEGDSESRLALKEMIERKRRNDFVRNREFDMLRKVRRRESLKEAEAAAAGGPSFYPSSQQANTGERARTLKKINEIEAQMSNAWFPAKESGAAAAPAAAHAATELMAPPVDAVAADDAITDPVPLPPAPQAALPPVAAFAPTLTMDQTVGLHDIPAPPARPSAPAFAPPPGIRLLGDVPEFNVEVVAVAKQDPEIEEAAIRFANGDTAGAEAVLLELVSADGRRREDVDTWLTLFDLYRCAGEPTKFDDAAFDFAAIFGRSAPQWALITEPGDGLPAPRAEPQKVVSAGMFHWTCPSVMGTQSIAALRATLERHAPPWRIDWRHLKTIDAAALPALIDVLERWAEAPVRLKFHGAERLLEVLADASPTDDRSVEPQWWLARLALLRVMGELDEFELVALNYCVTYEVSPPAWEEPRSRYIGATEEGQTLPPSESGAADTVPPLQGGAEAPTGAASVDAAGVVKAAFAGEYVGTASAALEPLAVPADEVTAFEINCRKLLRVDFGAAGDMLNWCMEQQSRGRGVSFKQVNRLVAAFFGVVGITESARVLLRTD